MKGVYRKFESPAFISTGRYKYLYSDELKELFCYCGDIDSLREELSISDTAFQQTISQNGDIFRINNYKKCIAHQLEKLGYKRSTDYKREMAKRFNVSLQVVYLSISQYGDYAHRFPDVLTEWQKRPEYSDVMNRHRRYKKELDDAKKERTYNHYFQYKEGVNFDTGSIIIGIDEVKKTIAEQPYTFKIDSILAKKYHLKPFKVRAFRHFNSIYQSSAIKSSAFFKSELIGCILFCYVRVLIRKKQDGSFSRISTKEAVKEFLSNNPFNIKCQSTLYKHIGDKLKEIRNDVLSRIPRTYTVIKAGKELTDIDLILNTKYQFVENESLRLTNRKHRKKQARTIESPLYTTPPATEPIKIPQFSTPIISEFDEDLPD